MLRHGARSVGVLLLLAATAPTAYADDPVSVGGCADLKHFCVGANSPGSVKPPTKEQTGGSSTGSGSNIDGLGRDCSFRPLDPPPPAGSALWQGHSPGDGAVYLDPCGLGNGITDGDNLAGAGRAFWAQNPPAAAVDPAVLAQRAVDSMLLRPPAIGIVPKPGGVGIVGMPVYMWTATGPETYGPNVASASAGAVTVTATARVAKIVWAMGDGTTVTCTTPGTPYQAQFGKSPSPDCGHSYRTPGKYHVTATSTWAIDWTGGGQSGQLTEIRSSAVDIAVGEVQVVGQ
ncbi:ATP/GTP-binding protein [Streptomyces sp. NPDC127069]|uniref:ATP/GTP-binding protein n=1 Tax=Streptomyces sp. NPDC127069 TaxID=3347128 RepID=UPI00366A373D